MSESNSPIVTLVSQAFDPAAASVKVDKRKKPENGKGARVTSDSKANSRAVKTRIDTITSRAESLNAMDGIKAYFQVRKIRCTTRCSPECSKHTVDYIEGGEFFDIPQKRRRQDSSSLADNAVPVEAIVQAVQTGFDQLMTKTNSPVVSTSDFQPIYNSPRRGDRSLHRDGPCYICRRNASLIGTLEISTQWIHCNIPSCHEKVHMACMGLLGSLDDDGSFPPWFCKNHLLEGCSMLKLTRRDPTDATTN